MTKQKLAFLAVLAATLLSFTRPLPQNANVWGRLSLAFAVVEDHTLAIDAKLKEAYTEDWSLSDGLHYSNKAPGPALAFVPVYAVVHAVAGRQRSFAAWLANALFGVIPTLFAASLLWRLLERRFSLAAPWPFALTATWAVASLALPNGTMLFGHQTAAAFFAIGMVLSLEEIEGGPRRSSRIALSGLFMGLAVSADYLCALLVLLWTVWLVSRTRADRRLLLAWVAGGAGPALALMAYHTACFGSPLTTPYSPRVLNPRFLPLVQWSAPQLDRLLGVTVQPWRGLFYATPVWALIAVGWDRAKEESRTHPEVVVAAIGMAVMLLVLAAWPSWFGGACIGPRYITCALPLATLLLVPATRLVPRLFVVLACVSAFAMLLATVVDPLPDSKWPDPFFSYILPVLARGIETPTRSLLEVAGLTKLAVLALYVAVWSMLAVWVVRTSTAPAEPVAAPPPHPAASHDSPAVGGGS